MSAKVKQGSADNGGKYPKKSGEKRGNVPLNGTKQQQRGLSAAAGAGIPPYQKTLKGGANPAGRGT